MIARRQKAEAGTAKRPSSLIIWDRKLVTQLVVHELQGVTIILNRLPGEPIEIARLIAQRKLSHHIKDYSFPGCARIFRVKLAAFDKFQIGIQFALKRQQMLALILIPIEMIADYQEHVAILAVKGNTINLIGFFDGHGAISWGVKG